MGIGSWSRSAGLLGLVLASGACAAVREPGAPVDRTPAAPPVDARWLAVHYGKSEVAIAMRDGVRLHTVIYRPRDAVAPAPVLLTRTPYGCRPYGRGKFPAIMYPDPAFAVARYIFVCQEVRGTHLSEGEWVHMRPHLPRKTGPTRIDESTDGYDTIDWIVRNVEGNNGRVGLWGASYPGFYVLSSMIDAHPALRCAIPMGPQTDWWYEDVFHHGAFSLSPVFWFAVEMGPRSVPGPAHPRLGIDADSDTDYAFFLNELGPLDKVDEKYFRGESGFWRQFVEHPRRDEYWRRRDIRPHLNRVAPAVLVVGGWFDESNLFGSLAAYREIEARNADAFNVLVLGPWEHTGWEWDVPGRRLGDMSFGSATSEFYRREVQRRFLEFFLETDRVAAAGQDALGLPEALVFETGGNRWWAFDVWPPARVERRDYYAAAGGGLSLEPGAETVDGFDEFVSDPNDPVPHKPGAALSDWKSYLATDQRFASGRDDVLTYRTPPLGDPFTVAGPIDAELWVSTDREDADWVVKVIDVLPATSGVGPERQLLLRAEVVRGRFRDDASVPRRFEPGRPTPVRVSLLDLFHTFLPGHRVMVQIQSTWFPLIDRNPQRWVENIFAATAADFRPAVHRVYRSPGHATRFSFPRLSDRSEGRPIEPHRQGG